MLSSEKFTSDFNRMTKITILNGLGFFFIDFLIPYVSSLEIKANGTEMGIIFSVRTIGYLAMVPFVASLSDRVSTKLLILLGSIGRGIAYFLLFASIIADSLGFIIAGNCLLGFMAGFFWIPLDILVSKKSDKTNRSEAFGKRSSDLGKGELIGAVIGFGFLTLFSTIYPGNKVLMYSPLVVFGIGNFIGGTLFYLFVDENKTISDEKEFEPVSYREYLKSLDKPFLIALFFMLIVFFLVFTNGSIAEPFILVYLTKFVESDPTLASLAFLPSGIFSMLIAPKLGVISDRFNLKFVIAFGSIFGGLVTFLIVNTHSLVIFAILMLLDTTAVMTVELVCQNIISRVSISNRGKLFGLQTIFMDMGSIFGPIFGGVLWDVISYKAPFYFSIVVEIILIPVFIVAITRLTPFLEEKIEPHKGEIRVAGD